MPAASKPISSSAASGGALVAFSTFVLSLAFPCRDYEFDGIAIAAGIEAVSAGAPPAILLHPHHVLYAPLAALAHALGELVGWSWRASDAMRLVSSLAAGSAIFLQVGLLQALGAKPAAALAGSALLACLYGWWRFGSMPDTTMLSTTALLGATRLTVSLAHSTRPVPRAAAAGASLAFAGALHASMWLFVPSALWLTWRLARIERARAVAAATAACALLALATYGVVGLWALEKSVPETVRWASGYLSPDIRSGYRIDYGAWHPDALSRTLRAAIGALVGEPDGAGGLRALVRTVCAGLAVGGAACLIGMGGLHRGGPVVWQAARPPLALYLLLHAVFFTWWNPGNLHFWIAPLPAAIACLVAAASALAPARLRVSPAAWIATLAALSLAASLAGSLPRQARRDFQPAVAAAEAIGRSTSEDAWIVVSGVEPWERLKAYVPYFAVRRVVILDWQFADPPNRPDIALARLGARLEALSSRGRLFVLSEAVAPSLDAHFSTYHRLARGELRKLLERCVTADETPLVDGLSLRRVARLAPPLARLFPSPLAETTSHFVTRAGPRGRTPSPLRGEGGARLAHLRRGYGGQAPLLSRAGVRGL